MPTLTQDTNPREVALKETGMTSLLQHPKRVLPASSPTASILQCNEAQHVESTKSRYKKFFIIRVILRLVAICTMITVAITLKLDIDGYLEILLDSIHLTFGDTWAPIVFCGVFSLWTSVSPMGYLPTVLCGVFFKWYIAPIVAYISINIGSLWNVLLIRYLILPNKTRCGIKQILHCCCGRKMGRVTILQQLFLSVPNPIRVVVLLRLPYLNNGVINYLFSLQVDSLTITQNVIGNLIGFIPGSILFSIFGTEIRSIAKVIRNGGFESTQQMILFITISIVSASCYVAIAVRVKRLIQRANDEKLEVDDHDQCDHHTMPCDHELEREQRFESIKMREKQNIGRCLERCDLSGRSRQRIGADPFCVCNQPNSGFMITCVGCEVLFHPACVDADEAELKELLSEGKDFSCPWCLDSLIGTEHKPATSSPN